MKTVLPVTHPAVTYWRCPLGDARVVVDGERFSFLAHLGQILETGDLADVLPLSVLEEAEQLVERHEQQHVPVGASTEGTGDHE